MTHSGGKSHTNVRDQGQRYEVHGVLHNGTDEIFGWQNAADGGLLESARLWPRFKSAYIVDRKSNQIEDEAGNG